MPKYKRSEQLESQLSDADRAMFMRTISKPRRPDDDAVIRRRILSHGGAFGRDQMVKAHLGVAEHVVREGGTFREIHYAPGTWETVVAEI